MFGIEWAIAAVVAAVAAAGASAYSANAQSKAQRAAARSQEKAAANAADQQEREFRRTNKNEVDTSAILAQQQALGSPSTLLTGNAGSGLTGASLGNGNNLLGG